MSLVCSLHPGCALGPLIQSHATRKSGCRQCLNDKLVTVAIATVRCDLAVPDRLRHWWSAMYKNIFCRFAPSFVAICGMSILPSISVFAATSTVQTLVFVRHGEKPLTGSNGQLTCQGQNRALALPPVLLGKFGTPQFLFAGAPVSNQDDDGNTYYYLRALATLEPTAIEAGLTINLKYANDDINDLQSELAKSKYASSLIFVALEHNDLDDLVAAIVKKYGGNASEVPAWPDDDFDSIFVLGITQSGSSSSVTFTHDYEGLNNQSTTCGSVVQRILPPPLSINR
jgi:hypothetical protein